MSGVTEISRLICYVCVAVSMISVIVPQKRTRKIMGFVIGLFLISVAVGGIAAYPVAVDFEELQAPAVPEHSEQEWIDLAAQKTAENLTGSLNELLIGEGIVTEDIQLTLKISEEGRIYAARVIIYISEVYAQRIGEIESIIYRNVAKEPEIYVAGQRVV